MSGKMFLGYFMKDNDVIDECLGGYEIFFIDEGKGLYKEMLTGLEFEKANYQDNHGLTALLCQRIDPNVRDKDIVKYKFLYDKNSIYSLFNRINLLKLTKHK